MYPRTSSLGKSSPSNEYLSLWAPRTSSLASDKLDSILLRRNQTAIFVHISNICAVFDNGRVLAAISNNLSPGCGCVFPHTLSKHDQVLYELDQHTPFDDFVKDIRFTTLGLGEGKVCVQNSQVFSVRNDSIIDFGPRARFSDTSQHPNCESSERVFLAVERIPLDLLVQWSSSDYFYTIEI
jgi:hypothetical protein